MICYWNIYKFFLIDLLIFHKTSDYSISGKYIIHERMKVMKLEVLSSS